MPNPTKWGAGFLGCSTTQGVCMAACAKMTIWPCTVYSVLCTACAIEDGSVQCITYI